MPPENEWKNYTVLYTFYEGGRVVVRAPDGFLAVEAVKKRAVESGDLPISGGSYDADYENDGETAEAADFTWEPEARP